MGRSVSLVIILACCLACCHRFQPSADDSYTQGREAITKGEYDKAITNFDKAIRLNPKNAAAYDNRAYAYELEENYEEAIADYKEAIRANPTYHYSYNNLAWLRATCTDARFRNGAEAVEFAKKACELANGLSQHTSPRWQRRVLSMASLQTQSNGSKEPSMPARTTLLRRKCRNDWVFTSKKKLITGRHANSQFLRRLYRVVAQFQSSFDRVFLLSSFSFGSG